VGHASASLGARTLRICLSSHPSRGRIKPRPPTPAGESWMLRQCTATDVANAPHEAHRSAPFVRRVSQSDFGRIKYRRRVRKNRQRAALYRAAGDIDSPWARRRFRDYV
jgi:hypothetical protein